MAIDELVFRLNETERVKVEHVWSDEVSGRRIGEESIALGVKQRPKKRGVLEVGTVADLGLSRPTQFPGHIHIWSIDIVNGVLLSIVSCVECAVMQSHRVYYILVSLPKKQDIKAH